MNSKKFIKILIIILALGAVLVGAYFLWQYLKPSPKRVSSQGGQESGSVSSLFSPVALSDDVIFDYWLNKKTGEIYYFDINGEMFKISSSGEKEDVGSHANGNLSYLKPSSDGSLVLIAFGYPQNLTFAIYNTASKTWRALPLGTTAAAWDPKSNSRLVYLKDNGEISRLNVFTLSDNKSKELLRLNQKDLDLDWNLSDVIYFKERPSTLIPTSLWAYNLINKTIRTLILDEPALMIKWSPDGRIGIKWSSGSLVFIDPNNHVLTSLDLKTLPGKCAFEELQVYCSAPTDQESLPVTFFDDYLKKSKRFRDDIYAIPLSQGNINLVNILKIKIFDALLSDSLIDAYHLEINHNSLLFINRYDKKIYRLQIRA